MVPPLMMMGACEPLPIPLSALFNPETSGAYKFYVNNDNEAELLLSTDQSEANLQSLGVFPLCTVVFDDSAMVTSPSVSTGKIYLV